MTRRTLMLLVATAIAVLLAGCGSSQKEEQGSGHGGSQREVGSSQQTSEPTTNETSEGHCADSGGTIGQQEEASRGEVSNGKIAFTRRTAANSDIYVTDQTGAHETQLTYTKQFEGNPVWSPDGKKIAFIRGQDTGDGIYVINADGTNQTELAENAAPLPFAWSPDGKKIAFIHEDDVQELKDIYVINADGTNEARLTKPPISETYYPTRSGSPTELGRPVWSPDGDKIAFASLTLEDTAPRSSTASAMAPVERLSGIYLINVDGTGLCKLTSTAEDIPAVGGPVWSPDGDKIAFDDGGSHHGSIDVINDDGSGRKELINHVNVPQLAWSPDGQRLAFVDTSASHLYVINDDGSGLRRLLSDPPGPQSWAVPTWSPDSGKIAFSCPFAAQGAAHTDLCVINADGTGLKRIASNVAPPFGYESDVAPSWGRE